MLCCSSLSCVRFFVALWTVARQAFLSITNFWSFLKLMSSELVMPFNHFIFCHPLLFLPSVFPTIRAFSNELAFCIRWLKYWSFSISLSMNIQAWFLLGLTGLILLFKGLKSFLQHHSLKASVLQCSAFFMVQLLHPYMTTVWKTIALTRRAFVGKVMFLLFNMLARFVIAFLPRSKHLLISWLQSPSAGILEPKKIKSVTVSSVSLFFNQGSNPYSLHPCVGSAES